MDNPNFGYIKKILEKTLGDQTLNPKPKAEELRTLKP
jgi:hypothetical protein